MDVAFAAVEWPYASAFRIAYDCQTHCQTVQVTLRDGEILARGEGVGIGYKGETSASILAQLETIRPALVEGLSRRQLQDCLPPGGARNAVDCALWDYECKRAGKRAWDLAGIGDVRPIATDFTLSLDSPRAMASAAAGACSFTRLKLKLGGDEDLERVMAVRTSRPDAELIVDANQAWSAEQLLAYLPRLVDLDVRLIEQPLPAHADQPLLDIDSPIPLCADESCQTRSSLADLGGKYEFVNIKLDKTGGLTEALLLADAAEAAGFELMVGCMAGSSLSMAPAFLIGQRCRFVDLDGPLLAADDVDHPIRYEAGIMHPPTAELWG